MGSRKFISLHTSFLNITFYILFLMYIYIQLIHVFAFSHFRSNFYGKFYKILGRIEIHVICFCCYFFSLGEELSISFRTNILFCQQCTERGCSYKNCTSHINNTNCALVRRYKQYFCSLIYSVIIVIIIKERM